MSYEYAVVPAPNKGLKAKGVKTAEDRFAHALQTVMNEYGAQGWEYVRTDTLPSEERSGFTGRTTVFQNMMVFRKEIKTVAPEEAVAAAIQNAVEAAAPAPTPVAAAPTAPAPTPEAAHTPAAAPKPAPEQMMRINTPPTLGRPEPTLKSK
jgi:hypothetical protein